MRQLTIPVVLTAGIILFSGCDERSGFDPTDETVVVARVDDAVLTKEMAGRLQVEQHASTLVTPSMESIVESWIDQQLIYQQALEEGLHEEPDLAWQLERYEMMVLGDELIKREVIDRMPKMTEADAVAYYEEHKDQFRAKEPMVWLWIIEREDEDTARRLINDRLAPDGSNFRSEAQMWSLGVSQAQGGDRGYVNETRVKPPVWRAAWELPLNTVSDVISYQVGDKTWYAVILVADRVQPGDYMKPEGVGLDMLKDRALQEQTRRSIESYLDELRQGHEVFTDYNLVADLEAWSRQTEEDIEDPTPLLENQ
ncbi:MAG: hypothetical protein GF403_00240 [Candidatus Coatesbacteria bacterium]|nr:hypothetical protein [Candidatus Coatesbacteria bacterium]